MSYIGYSDVGYNVAFYASRSKEFGEGKDGKPYSGKRLKHKRGEGEGVGS